MGKQDEKPRLLQWFLLLQEFDFTVQDKRGQENVATDHLSRLENPPQEETRYNEIHDDFPDEYVMRLSTNETPQ